MLGKKDEVERLLADGANVNEVGEWGRTALGWAVAGQHPDVVKLLLEKGARPNQAESYNGLTPLRLAVSKNAVQIVKLLLDYGADPNELIPSRYRHGLLSLAIWSRYVEVAKLLVGAGANVNARSNFNAETSLMTAARTGNVEMVELLVRKGADIHAYDSNYRQAIDLATGTISEMKELRKLLGAGE
jgi:ankyrin repeat protein